jgi:hypothetical protein
MLDDQKIVNFVTHIYVMPFSYHVDKNKFAKWFIRVLTNSKKSFNLIIWIFLLLAFELEHQKINFIKHLTKEYFNKEILMEKK